MPAELSSPPDTKATVKFSLRKALPGDIAAIAQLEREIFGDAEHAFQAWQVRQHIDAGGPLATVAVDAHNACIGYCLAEPILVPTPLGKAAVEGWIQAVTVRQSAQGNGIGGALVRKTIETAEELGLKALHLTVERNNPAWKLYRRLGFRASHIDPAYFGPGEARVVMRWSRDNNPGEETLAALTWKLAHFPDVIVANGKVPQYSIAATQRVTRWEAATATELENLATSKRQNLVPSLTRP